MRQIFSHSGQTARPVRIQAEEPAFRGEIPHQYVISGFDTTANRSVRSGGYVPNFREIALIFADEQSYGIVPDGVTVDSLLAVVADFLHNRTQSPSAQPGDSLALDYIEQARSVMAGEMHAPNMRHYSHASMGNVMPL